jgi:hypothetical protein
VTKTKLTMPVARSPIRANLIGARIQATIAYGGVEPVQKLVSDRPGDSHSNSGNQCGSRSQGYPVAAGVLAREAKSPEQAREA